MTPCRETIPVFYSLAQNYLLMDNYFASFPGSTMPNRLFVHSATSHGEINTDGTQYVILHLVSDVYVFF